MRSPSFLGTAAVLAAAAALGFSVVAVSAAPPGTPTATAPSDVQLMPAADVQPDGSCTVELDGSTWTFNPCLTPGEPLPQDVVDALADLDRTRDQYPSGTPSPTEPPLTDPPPPGPTYTDCPTTTAPTTTSPSTTAPTTTFPTGPSTGPSTVTPTTAAPTLTSDTAVPTVIVKGRNALPTATATDTATAIPTDEPTDEPTGPTESPTGLPTGCPTFPSPTGTSTGTGTGTPTGTPTETGTGTPTGTPTDTGTGTPTDTSTPTETPTCPTGTPTETPTETPTATPTDCPTSTAPPTTTTNPPTTDPTGTPTDPGCGPTQPTPPNEQDLVKEADKDRIGTPRDPSKIECDKRVVLTASGDSVTSAHNQTGFGPMCAATAADARGLTGNDANFSYAGRYYAANANIVRYFNFARTGYGTREMLTAAGAGFPDACGNPWARAASPVALSAAAIRQAKRDGYKAYHVTTGGVNNTNWTTVLKQVTYCRAMEYAQANLLPRAAGRFWWAGPGGKAGVVTQGGGCVLQVYSPFFWRPDAFVRIGIPRFDGPANYPVITADVTATVNALLGAGADKIVWMLYYDITLANLDVANTALGNLGPMLPAWAARLLPAAVPAVNVSLIDPAQAVAVRGMINAVNAAITAGIPANAKVGTVPGIPGVIVGAGQIQNTGLGGSPHPSAAGHIALQGALAAKFNAIP